MMQGIEHRQTSMLKWKKIQTFNLVIYYRAKSPQSLLKWIKR
jgi:hypothetical protein